MTVMLPRVGTVDGTSVPTVATIAIGSDGIERGTTANPLPVSAPATTLTDRTVTMSATQAAGTAPVLAANPARRYLAVTPASDGRLYIVSGGTGFFYVLYGGVTMVLTGADCPTNALYATGQPVGAALPMAEG